MVIFMAKSNNFFKLDMLVLCVLSQHDCYGYEIVKLIYEISDNIIQIKEGTLYPIVHQLLKLGYISSHDVVVNKKIRVYYHIEESGISYLKESIQEFDTNLRGILSIINYRKD